MITCAGSRVLIVEDGDEDRMVYRIMLTRRAGLGLAITLAANGEEGLDALRRQTFDCMLIDHDLPDMTGLELLDQIAGPDGRPPCACVMVTGSHDERIPEEARRRGVSAVMFKDELEEGRLRAALDEALASASPSVPTATMDGADHPEADGPGPAPGPARTLSIAEAKDGLAATFGISPANVEIIIRA
jgi:CheY-like chemotaxis protein